MTLRADHVSGAAFVLFGLAVIALSRELPTGQLSMPGAGFMPMIVAVLLIVIGAALILRAGESPTFASIDWSDFSHAAKVIAIAAAAVVLYVKLGFIVTLIAMIMALLIVIERRHPRHAVTYSVGVVVTTYLVFIYVLKTPLPDGIFGY